MPLYLERLLPKDRVFSALVFLLAFAGIAIFSSAALGLLTSSAGSVSRAVLLQAGLGLGLGLSLFFIIQALPLALVKRYAPHVYAVTVLCTLLVFVPGVGFHAGGATRWISVGFTTVQPAEFLKIGFVLALAWWLAPRARQLKDLKRGLAPLAAFVGAPALLLFLQPNNSTMFLIVATACVMYIAAGAPWRDLGIMLVAAVIIIGGVLVARPYVLTRVETFLHPSAHPLGSGYQIRQAMIAVGSGGIFGRGFGQGVEKFAYLPEPDGDSVFAVFAEETGFVGALILIALFVALAARGMVIAEHSTDLFGGLLATGLSFLIVLQAFVNMGAMLGVIPLTGLPLPFISHGGTALVAVFISCALILVVAGARKRRAV
jgi:cell division protein FtsW